MESVTYEQIVADVAKGIEGVGAGIMIFGGLLALGRYALSTLSSEALGDKRSA